jgi:Gas vesicle synthesis protein GvpL/GvpF
LRGIIERLAGREEWGVNVYRDRVMLMEAITLLSPRLRELIEQAASASPGQAYLLKKKIDAMKSDEARIEVKRVIEEIEGKLSSVSDGTARLRVLKDEAAEQGGVAAKMAFLVERGRFDRFRARAESLAEEYAASGFKLELTGPWPAYNFADEKAEA